MKKTIQFLTGTLFVLLLGSMTVLGQEAYDGNGQSGFGGTLGNGSLEVSDDGTTITFEFTTGSAFNDAVIIYLDTDPSGGITSTANLTDNADGGRKGVSGYDGSNRSQIDFASGFEPEYAISVESSFVGLFEIVENGSHNFQTSGNLSGTGPYTFDFDFSEIGADEKTFKFVATYLNNGNVYRSNEAIGASNAGSNNIGHSGDVAGGGDGDGSMTFSGFESYHSVQIIGSEGWRILSTPTSDNSYDDLLGNLWTQGIAAGADVTNGTANVQIFDGSTFSGVSDLTATMDAGVGFITYIYSDDDYDGTPEGFPKALSLSGTENSGPISPTLTSGADEWTLVGNPFASTIDWDDLTKTDLTGTVYVYDHSDPGYISWNGTAGSLTNGLIAPFQGFWVQNAGSGTPSLIIEEADKTTGGIFYKEAQNELITIKLHGEMDNMFGEAFLSFTENGQIEKDNFDGLKLTPLDFHDYLSVATVTGDTKLDINNLPAVFDDKLEIPVSIKGFMADMESEKWVAKGGEVSLTWPVVNNIPEDWFVMLKDFETGESIDIRKVDSYEFNLEGSQNLSKQRPSATILNPQPPQLERLAKGVDESRFAIIIAKSNAVGINEDNATPETFTLNQNYPNPFNPTTSIQYSVAEAGAVSLTIYNVMGQQVTTLVNETKSAGTYRVTWDAANSASGIYYYRLQAGNTVLTRQMTLIK